MRVPRARLQRDGHVSSTLGNQTDSVDIEPQLQSKQDESGRKNTVEIAIVLTQTVALSRIMTFI